MKASIQREIDKRLADSQKKQRVLSRKTKAKRLDPANSHVSPRTGRPTPSKWSAREVAEICGFDPLAVLIDIVRNGRMPAMPIPNPHPENGDGPIIMEAHEVSTEERVKTARDLMHYLYPTLSATQVTGKDGGPIQTTNVDITLLMGDPALAEAAQSLSLALTAEARRQRLMLPASGAQNEEQPQNEEDIIDAETEDP